MGGASDDLAGGQLDCLTILIERKVFLLIGFSAEGNHVNCWGELIDYSVTKHHLVRN